jgi:hypothetical protein
MVFRILTFIFLFICYGFYCENCETELNRNYNHEISYSDFKKIYTKGEILLLPIEFSAVMNCENNEVFNNSNGNVTFWFRLMKIRENNQDVTDGLFYFEVGDTVINFNQSHAGYRDLEGYIYFNCGPQSCEGNIPIKCLSSGYYALHLLHGSFGEYNDCDRNNLNLTFTGDDNNFSICSEINTTRFRVSDLGGGGNYFSQPAHEKRMYFFKVVD